MRIDRVIRSESSFVAARHVNFVEKMAFESFTVQHAVSWWRARCEMPAWLT